MSARLDRSTGEQACACAQGADETPVEAEAAPIAGIAAFLGPVEH